MTLEVMLPFYGRTDHLREAVESVLRQDDPDWRLTVLDDAYPDPSAAAWVADLRDERVRLLRNERNLGVSGSFQKCLELAREEWLVVMGGDDRMLPAFVGRMRADIAAHPGVTYVQPGVQIIDESGHPSLPLADRIKGRIRITVDRPTVIDARTMTESLLRGNWMYFPATAWRREAVLRHGFEPRYEIVLDWLLQLQLLQDDGTVLLDPDVTFEYRRHARQVSTGAAYDLTRFEEEKALMLGIRDLTRRRGWTRASRRAAIHITSRLHALTIAGRLLLHGRVVDMGPLLRHALTNKWPPGQWPAIGDTYPTG